MYAVGGNGYLRAPARGYAEPVFVVVVVVWATYISKWNTIVTIEPPNTIGISRNVTLTLPVYRSSRISRAGTMPP